MADAGKIVITPKGVYSSTSTYEWLDEVTYDGKSYIALKTVTGVTPIDDGVNWRLFLDPNDIIAGNLVPTFTEASTRSNIISEENLSTILGKVKKYFTDLKGHAFNDTVKNLTTEETGSALDASQGKVLKDEVDEINSNLVEQKMLGWTVPKECPIQNEVSGNQFIQKVGRIAFDDLNIDVISGNTLRIYSPSNAYKEWEKVYYLDGYTPRLPRDYAGWANESDKTIGCVTTYDRFVVKDLSCDTLDAFKNKLQGKYIYYKLATPITMAIDGNEKSMEIDRLAYGEVAGGKNLCNYNAFVNGQVVSGITYTKRNDGILAKGTANGSNTCLLERFIAPKDGKYTVSIHNNTNIRMYIDVNSSSSSAVQTETYVTKDVKKNDIISIYLKRINDVATNETINIMIEEGTTATSYESYIPSVKMLAEEVDNVNESLDDYGLVNKFDGAWLQGYYDINKSGAFTSDSTFVCNANAIKCASGNVIRFKFLQALQSRILYFNGNTYVSSSALSALTEASYTVPSGVDNFKFYVYTGSAISPSTVCKTVIYVGNEIDKLKKDLSDVKTELLCEELQITGVNDNIYIAINNSFVKNGVAFVDILFSELSNINEDTTLFTINKPKFSLYYNHYDYEFTIAVNKDGQVIASKLIESKDVRFQAIYPIE